MGDRSERNAQAWLAAVGAELRSAVGSELRLESEAEERAVARLRIRSRTLADVAAEMMHGGTEVTVWAGGSSTVGRVVHAAADLMTLKTGTGARLHVNLGVAPTLRASGHARPAGRGRGRRGTGCASFVAQLRALEIEGTSVRLATRSPAGGLTGCVAAVAPDHIVFHAGDAEWLVSMQCLDGVWEDRPREGEPGGGSGLEG